MKILLEILDINMPEDEKEQKDVKHLNSSPGDDIKSKTRQYLNSLDKDTVEKLVQVYKHDFELFDYDPLEHLN